VRVASGPGPSGDSAAAAIVALTREVDGELEGWLAEAYRVGEERHLR